MIVDSSDWQLKSVSRYARASQLFFHFLHHRLEIIQCNFVGVVDRNAVYNLAMNVWYALFFMTFCFVSRPELRAQNNDAKEFLPPLPTGKQWKLIWHDEFDGTQLDETKWNRLGDWKRRDGFWVKEDANLSGKGTLLLRTKKDGDRYTCGAVNTQGKFEHSFGFYVARCRMPKQTGHWPAFWIMGPGVNKVGNDGRDGTEIDIVEIPWRDGKVTFNLHWDGYGKEHKSAGTNRTIGALTEGFHNYALLWTPEEYVIYVDGQETWRTKAGGVSQVPEYLKLTEEIGIWGGDISKAELPDYFEVDYVRVYEMSQ